MKNKYEELRSKGTESFATSTKRDLYWKLLANERKFFLDPITRRTKKNLIEEVICPVCEKNNTKAIFMKDGFQYVKCKDCGMLYINPQLKEDILTNYYRHSPAASFWTEILISEPQLDFDQKKYRECLEEIEKITGLKNGKLLDIGCSIGTFLDIAREKGHKVSGIELSERARQIAKEKYNLKLISKPLEKLNLPESTYDLITFWEVLEHTKNPRILLDISHKLLKKKGILVSLLGGNAHSFAARVMQSKSVAFDFGRLWYFTPPSFEKLLAGTGFNILKTKSIIPEIDTVLNYMSYEDPYFPEVQENLFPSKFLEMFKELILSQNMGYKLLVVAQRSDKN